MLNKKRIFESLETNIKVLKKALLLIADEWKIVAKNFTLIDEDEISIAVNLINSYISSIKRDDLSDIINSLESDNDLDMFDDIYLESKNNKDSIIADCYILNSKLSEEERDALVFIKNNVEITSERENGRDILRIKITI